MNRRQFISTTAVAGLALASRAADPPAKFRVAVIAHTGRGGYGHGLDTMWLQLPGTEIVAVADADAKGLESALKTLRVTKSFAEYRKMLAETRPDIVAIGPRHIDQHRDMSVARSKPACAAFTSRSRSVARPLRRMKSSPPPNTEKSK